MKSDARDRIFVTTPPDVISPFEDTFYPLGFPVIVTSNSEAVLEAAHAEWDTWAKTFDESPIRLHFEISDASGSQPPAIRFHARGNVFAFIADADNLAIGDTQTRSGTAWLSPGAIRDASYFSYHFLESMALVLIVSLHLAPIHAGCVAREGRGVLLCGDGGAGKSSLSYACARRGWTFLSDDASYLLRSRASESLVLGHPQRVRLRPDAPQIFPELANYETVIRGSGKPGLDLRTNSLGIATATSALVDRVVILYRKTRGKPRLTPVDESTARPFYHPFLYWWNAEIAAAQLGAFDRLFAASRVFTLEYSDLDAAVDLLES